MSRGELRRWARDVWAGRRSPVPTGRALASAEGLLFGAEIQALEAALAGDYWAVYGEDRRRAVSILEKLVRL